MRQKIRYLGAVLAATLLAALVCGCGASVPLSDRAVIKTVFIDHEQGDYQAVLVAFDCTESADAGEAESLVTLLRGSGATPAQAVQAAEKSQEKKMFYGQNQMLWLGRTAALGRLEQVLDYFGAEQAARPNMAVFVTGMGAREMEEAAEEGKLAEAIGQLERRLEQGGGTARMVYELPVSDDAQGVIPLLELGENGPAVPELILYRDGRPIERIAGVQAQLAGVLAGKSRKLQYEAKYDGSLLGVAMESVQVTREVYEEENGPVLRLTLTGNVRTLRAQGARQQAELASVKKREKISREISQELRIRLEQLTTLCRSEGCDAFGLNWWFGAWDAGWYRQALQTGEIWQPQRIEVCADVAVT